MVTRLGRGVLLVANDVVLVGVSAVWVQTRLATLVTRRIGPRLTARSVSSSTRW